MKDIRWKKLENYLTSSVPGIYLNTYDSAFNLFCTLKNSAILLKRKYTLKSKFIKSLVNFTPDQVNVPLDLKQLTEFSIASAFTLLKGLYHF